VKEVRAKAATGIQNFGVLLRMFFRIAAPSLCAFFVIDFRSVFYLKAPSLVFLEQSSS